MTPSETPAFRKVTLLRCVLQSESGNFVPFRFSESASTNAHDSGFWNLLVHTRHRLEVDAEVLVETTATYEKDDPFVLVRIGTCVA